MSHKQTGIVVLAAGAASRMGGRNKLTEKFGSSSVLESTLKHLLEAGLKDIQVVYGDAWGDQWHLSPDVLAAISKVHNPDATSGMGSSIAAGVQHLPQDTDRIMVALGDMPSIQSDTIRALLDFAAKEPANIWRTRYSGTPGHPVLFDGSWRDRLCVLDGEQGGSELMRDARAVLAYLDVEDPGVLQDIDTPQDLERLSAASG